MSYNLARTLLTKEGLDIHMCYNDNDTDEYMGGTVYRDDAIRGFLDDLSKDGGLDLEDLIHGDVDQEASPFIDATLAKKKNWGSSDDGSSSDESSVWVGGESRSKSPRSRTRKQLTFNSAPPSPKSPPVERAEMKDIERIDDDTDASPYTVHDTSPAPQPSITQLTSDITSRIENIYF